MYKELKAELKEWLDSCLNTKELLIDFKSKLFLINTDELKNKWECIANIQIAIRDLETAEYRILNCINNLI